MARLDRSMIAEAFRALPPRWQEVLWYTDVESMKPRHIAEHLGIKPSAVTALARRAREGLRQAWIALHLDAATLDPGCHAVLLNLPAYVRGGLGARATAEVAAHLLTCADCRAIAAEAASLSSKLALVLLPLSVGAAIAAAYSETSSTAHDDASVRAGEGPEGAVADTVGWKVTMLSVVSLLALIVLVALIALPQESSRTSSDEIATTSPQHLTSSVVPSESDDNDSKPGDTADPTTTPRANDISQSDGSEPQDDPRPSFTSPDRAQASPDPSNPGNPQSGSGLGAPVFSHVETPTFAYPAVSGSAYPGALITVTRIRPKTETPTPTDVTQWTVVASQSGNWSVDLIGIRPGTSRIVAIQKASSTGHAARVSKASAIQTLVVRAPPALTTFRTANSTEATLDIRGAPGESIIVTHTNEAGDVDWVSDPLTIGPLGKVTISVRPPSTGLFIARYIADGRAAPESLA